MKSECKEIRDRLTSSRTADDERLFLPPRTQPQVGGGLRWGDFELSLDTDALLALDDPYAGTLVELVR